MEVRKALSGSRSDSGSGSGSGSGFDSGHHSHSVRTSEPRERL